MNAQSQRPDDLPIHTEWDEIPTGPTVGYHETPVRNRDAIMRHGIRPMDRGPTGSEIDAILQEHGDAPDPTRPSHRSDCVFLYPDHSRGCNPSDEVVTVTTCIVDLTAIDAPIYTACYDTVTDLYGPVTDDEIPEIAHAYWDSCRPYEPGDDHEGELLVEGRVPADAITHRFNPHAE